MKTKYLFAKQKLGIFILCLFINLFVVSCSSKSDKSASFEGGETNVPGTEQSKLAKEDGVVVNEEMTNATATDALESPPPPPPPSTKDAVANEDKVEPKIIKTATINCEIEDYENNKVILDSIVSKWNATISQENEMRNVYNISNTIRIRVPNQNFENLIAEIVKIASRVDSKVITAEDVTAQYVDAQARMKAKKVVELQYIELLKRANSIDDILNVTQYLRQIREEIEAKEGQLKYIDDQASLSTINLYVYESFTPSEVKRQGFWAKVGESFVDGWNGILALIIGLINIWPILIIFGILIFFIIKKIRKSKNKN